MPYSIPNGNHITYINNVEKNVEKVLDWLWDAASGAKNLADIVKFLVQNDPQNLSKLEGQVLKEGLAKVYMVKVEIGPYTIPLGLNLLQVAALQGNPDVLKTFLKLYEAYTGMSSDTLLTQQYSGSAVSNGYNLLHLAVLNLKHRATAEWIMKHAKGSEAANAGSLSGQLPIELAFKVHNTELIRSLVDVTTTIFVPDSDKSLKKLDLELQKLIGDMEKDREEILEARKEINSLIKQLEIVKTKTITRLHVQTRSNQYFFAEKSEFSVCYSHITLLEKIYNNPKQYNYSKNNQNITEIKRYLEDCENYYSDENILKVYQELIKEVSDEIADLLGIPRGSIVNIANTLEKNGFQGDLSFLNTEKFTNKSIEETLSYLKELTSLRNRFFRILNQVKYRHLGVGQFGIAGFLVAIYNYSQSLSPLMQKYSPQLLDGEGFLGLGPFSSLVDMKDKFSDWLKLYKEVDEINGKYVQLHLPPKLTHLNTHINGVGTMISNSEALGYLGVRIENDCKAWQKELVKYENMAKLHSKEWHKLVKFIQVFDRLDPTKTMVFDRLDPSKAMQTVKNLALEFVTSIDKPDDARLFMDEVKDIYFKHDFNKSDQEHIAAYFEALNTLNGLPRDLSLAPEFKELTGITLKGVVLIYGNNKIYGFSIDNEFADLNTKQLKQLTEDVKRRIAEQNKKTELARESLQKEKEILTGLVTKYKQLAGDNPKYIEEADHLWQASRKASITHVDDLADLNTVKEAIRRGKEATATLEVEIESAKEKISKQLDREAVLVKKLRHIGTLNQNQTKEEKQTIDTIENTINQQRKRLKNPFSLVELTAFSSQCEQSYNATKESLLQMQGYFDNKKADLDKLATELKGLISRYLGNEALESLTKGIESLTAEMDSFKLSSVDAEFSSYKTITKKLHKDMEHELDRLRIDNNLLDRLKIHNNFRERVKRLADAEDALNKTLSVLNKKLGELQGLRDGLQFASASKKLFDDINSEIKNLLGESYLRGYATPLDAVVDKPIKQKAIVLKAFDDTESFLYSVNKIIYYTEEYTEKVETLSKKIISKEAEIKKAEAAAKQQAEAAANQQANKEVTKAKDALIPKIYKLIDLQQNIALTKVDPTSEIFEEHKAVIISVLTITDAEEKNLTITTIRDVNTLLNQLENQDQIAGFGTKLDMAIKEAGAALKKAITKQLQDKVAAYNKKLVELQAELKEPVTNPSSRCQEKVEKFTALMGQAKFSKESLKPDVDTISQSLSTQSIKNFSESWQKIEQAHDEAIKAMDKEIKELKGRYDAQKKTKEQEYTDLKRVVTQLKEDLTKWSAKKYLVLNWEELNRLLLNIDAAMIIAHDGEKDYLTFLNEEIAKLKVLKTDSNKFVEEAKRIEIQYQQHKDQAELNDRQQLEKVKAILSADLGRFLNLTRNLLFLNPLVNLRSLTSSMSISDGDLETLIANSTNKEEIENAHQYITNFIETYFKPAVSAELKGWLERFVDSPYQTTCKGYESIKNDEDAKAVVSQCETLDQKFEKDIINPNLFSNSLSRQVFSAFTTHYLLDKSVEMPSTDFCAVLNKLKTYVDKHCTKVDEKVKTYKAAQKQAEEERKQQEEKEQQKKVAAEVKRKEEEEKKRRQAEEKESKAKLEEERKQKEEYESELNKIKILQARYDAVQNQLKPNSESQKQLNDVILEIEQKGESKQYRDAIDQISNETPNLNKLLRAALDALLTKALEPYRATLKKLTSEELSKSQVPEAVKKLYELLSLKAPKHLTDNIVPKIDLIVKAKDQTFYEFVTKLESYANDAATAVDGEKDRLDNEDKAALEKANEALRQKKQKEFEDQQKKLLEQAQKEKDALKKLEDAQKKEEAAKLKKEEEARKKEAEEAKKRQEKEEARKKEAEEAKKRQEKEEARKKEAEEARKRQEEEEARKKEAEEARKRQEEEDARKKEAEEAKKKQEEEDARKKAQQGQGVGTQKGTSKPGTSTTEPPSSVADGIFGALPIAPKTTATKPKTTDVTVAAPVTPKTTTTPPVIKPKATGKTVAAPSADESGGKKKKKTVTVSDPSKVEEAKVEIEHKRSMKFKDLYPRQQKAILLIREIQLKIQAQAEFNPARANELLTLEEQLLTSSAKIRGTVLETDYAIDRYLGDFNSAFKSHINAFKIAEPESFSFVRFFRVFFGIGNKVDVVDRDQQVVQVEIKHSNTVKFLEALEKECNDECERIYSSNKSNYVPGSNLQIGDGLLSGTSKKQEAPNYKEVSTPEPTQIPAVSRREQPVAEPNSQAYTSSLTSKEALKFYGDAKTKGVIPQQPPATTPQQIDIKKVSEIVVKGKTSGQTGTSKKNEKGIR